MLIGAAERNFFHIQFVLPNFSGNLEVTILNLRKQNSNRSKVSFIQDPEKKKGSSLQVFLLTMIETLKGKNFPEKEKSEENSNKKLGKEKSVKSGSFCLNT